MISIFENGKLVSARRFWRGLNGSGNRERGFLRKLIKGRERLRANRILHYDALAYAGAIAHQFELNLPAGSLIIEPSAQGDLLAHVLA